MDDLTKELDEREIERIQRIVKHILPETILGYLLDELLRDEESRKPGGETTKPDIPEGALIPNIRTGKSYLINPSRFDTCVKLIKTLALDRKKPTIIYCSRFSPRVLTLGLIANLTKIPLKRLLSFSLKDKDIKSISLILPDLQDLPAVFLQDSDLDYPSFIANMEMLGGWLHPEVVLFDDCQKIPGEESRNGGMYETDNIREDLSKLAQEQGLAVIAIT